MLTNYCCTACNAHPSTDKEVFYGCKCGNKLFRLNEKSISKQKNSRMILSKRFNLTPKEEQLAPISVNDTGVFSIDVEQLFSEEDSQVVAVADKKGVIHIKL